jgi:hypothetical protein
MKGSHWRILIIFERLQRARMTAINREFNVDHWSQIMLPTWFVFTLHLSLNLRSLKWSPFSPYPSLDLIVIRYYQDRTISYDTTVSVTHTFCVKYLVWPTKYVWQQCMCVCRSNGSEKNVPKMKFLSANEWISLLISYLNYHLNILCYAISNINQVVCTITILIYTYRSYRNTFTRRIRHTSLNSSI